MTKPSTDIGYRMARAVAYLTDSRGALTIKLLAPWDGKGRLESYPASVRLAVRAQAFLFATVEESHKIWTAREMGADVHAAVWDDLLCDRADAMMENTRRRVAQIQRDDEITYAPANQPSWLNALQDRLDGKDEADTGDDNERNDR